MPQVLLGQFLGNQSNLVNAGAFSDVDDLCDLAEWQRRIPLHEHYSFVSGFEDVFETASQTPQIRGLLVDLDPSFSIDGNDDRPILNFQGRGRIVSWSMRFS